MSLLIHNAVLVDGSGRRHGWVKVSGDKIEKTGAGQVPADEVTAASEVIDAHGAYLIPGLTDTHVHFREPGLEYKGDMVTESLAAVAGGVTTVFDMPNTKPATTTAADLEAKRALVASRPVHCRIIPLLGLVPGALHAIQNLPLDNVPAFKLFLGTSTGAMASPEGKELEDVFRFSSDHQIPVIVHAEDNEIIAANTAAAVARYGSAEAVPVSMHSSIRSREACLRSSAFAVELAHRFNTRLHIAHISTAEEVTELLSAGPTKGKLVTAETTPLYIDPVISDGANRTSLHKVNPAIKTTHDAEVLRSALASGAIDTIGTDHAPHLLKEKQLPGITAMSGAPSIQFALPVMLTYLPLEKIVEKMTMGPHEVFKLPCAVSIEAGTRADIVLVREVPEYTIDDASVVSRCGWTPFAGRTVRHKVEATWVAGRKVWG